MIVMALLAAGFLLHRISGTARIPYAIHLGRAADTGFGADANPTHELADSGANSAASYSYRPVPYRPAVAMHGVIAAHTLAHPGDTLD
jgi:hypothetical protein